jgi:hypothetical protein
MREPGELERRGEMDGFIDQLGAACDGGVAGGQVSQLRPAEFDGGEAGDCERVCSVVVQQEQALGPIGGVTEVAAGEMGDRACWQLGQYVRFGRAPSGAVRGRAGHAGFGKYYGVGKESPHAGELLENVRQFRPPGVVLVRLWGFAMRPVGQAEL